ncbi:DUF412 domain-containing protein [Alginatibacterium sediminis]|uniref:UPF0208 membrane protein YfbV n=1 Tax=Alginatibacterium sediminis TaxID=2164068 RepID=A0A420E9Z1_9ALTE|nr:terminus macrodomain insulation protein YfbV [Alginatibacterium sediminis]RKF17494.1 DUF412 domain-containing protein [Alginatibacterium sediminis]
MTKLAAILKDGQRYMKAWPKEAVLSSMFPESRVIFATSLAIKTMPAIAVATVTLPFIGHQDELLPQAMMMATVLFFMPLQGLYWLGSRANENLPPSLANWYRDMHQKLSAAGESVPKVSTRPRYFDLASVLRQAFERFDKGFVLDQEN